MACAFRAARMQQLACSCSHPVYVKMNAGKASYAFT